MQIAAAVILAAALAFAQSIAGSYKGTWAGAASGGDFHLTVKSPTDAQVGFTIEGKEVPCKILSLKIDGASMEMVYEFDLQGTKLQSATKGTLKGKTLEGTYTTSAGDSPVDTGTWKTTAQ
jgi:hypothetical protein